MAFFDRMLDVMKLGDDEDEYYDDDDYEDGDFNDDSLDELKDSVNTDTFEMDFIDFD